MRNKYGVKRAHLYNSRFIRNKVYEEWRTHPRKYQPFNIEHSFVNDFARSMGLDYDDTNGIEGHGCRGSWYGYNTIKIIDAILEKSIIKDSDSDSMTNLAIEDIETESEPVIPSIIAEAQESEVELNKLTEDFIQFKDVVINFMYEIPYRYENDKDIVLEFIRAGIELYMTGGNK